MYGKFENHKKLLILIITFQGSEECVVPAVRRLRYYDNCKLNCILFYQNKYFLIKPTTLP